MATAQAGVFPPAVDECKSGRKPAGVHGGGGRFWRFRQGGPAGNGGLVAGELGPGAGVAGVVTR
ncbi:MAG: hypothetical protein ACKOJF_30035 [Planctomycetaceae bacterium]